MGVSQTQAVQAGLGSQEEGQPWVVGSRFSHLEASEFCLAEPIIVHKPCGLLGKGKWVGQHLRNPEIQREYRRSLQVEYSNSRNLLPIVTMLLLSK